MQWGQNTNKQDCYENEWVNEWVKERETDRQREKGNTIDIEVKSLWIYLGKGITSDKIMVTERRKKK